MCNTKNKRLTEITELDGAVRKFTYTEDGKIKDVINPKGIVAITNEYDGQSRTTKQSFPDGSVMTYDYDDINKTTTATEQNGNKVVYTHDDMERHTATGVGFFGTVAAGGISTAGGNMVTQYQKTGTINSREVATAIAGGMLGAGIGYGI